MHTVTKAFSTIEIKSIDDGRRTLSGIASTPSTDRVGDVVLPKGAKFTLPVALLWQHDRYQPVGHITAARVTDDGIYVEGELVQPVDGMPSGMTARLDEAYYSIKTKLVRGLSIGFVPMKYKKLDNGGIEYKEWDWTELSLVTIPANAEATIATIKAAASGDTTPTTPPPRTTKSVKIDPIRKGADTMNYQDMIKRLEATMAEKEKERDAIQKTVLDEGRTKDASEREAYDTLIDEIDALQLELRDVRELEKKNIQNAKPVENEVKEARQYSGIVIKRAPEKLDPGIEFARYAMCLGAAKGDLTLASRIAQQRYKDMDRLNSVLKDAVTPATALPVDTDSTWAANLVDYRDMVSDFVNYLRPRTIIGQFGQNGVPALRSIPFNTTIKGQSQGLVAGWTAEGANKPVTSGAYTSVNLSWCKLAAIAVATDELLRFSTPAAERLIRDDLAAAVTHVMDEQFIQIAKGTTGEQGTKCPPDSITYKAFKDNSSPAAGDITSAANLVAPYGDTEAALNALWVPAAAADYDLSSGVYITTPSVALKLAGMMTITGARRFPNVSFGGGSINGVPVIVSNHVDTNAILLVLANEIWLADDGMVTLDASREASIIMDTAPNADDPAGGVINMFQTNSVAFRAERYVNWMRRRPFAVNGISAANLETVDDS